MNVLPYIARAPSKQTITILGPKVGPTLGAIWSIRVKLIRSDDGVLKLRGASDRAGSPRLPLRLYTPLTCPMHFMRPEVKP